MAIPGRAVQLVVQYRRQAEILLQSEYGYKMIQGGGNVLSCFQASCLFILPVKGLRTRHDVRDIRIYSGL